MIPSARNAKHQNEIDAGYRGGLSFEFIALAIASRGGW
jgi:hypothetical protein